MIDYLKCYTQAILPLVFDDSLSYLEILSKVTQKLNEVIKIYNETGPTEYLDELFNSYVESEDFKNIIKNYVSEQNIYLDVTNPPSGYEPLINDGITDNTELLAQYNEFNGTLFFPSGVYVFKHCNFNCDVLGSGPNSTTFLCVNSDLDYFVKSTKSIKDVNINANRQGQTKNIVAYIGNENSSAYNVIISRAYTAINLNGSGVYSFIFDDVSENGLINKTSILLSPKIVNLNIAPLNAVELGMDNSGNIDCSDIFNNYNKYPIYFPSGTYKFEKSISVKNSIYGDFNFFGLETRDSGKYSKLIFYSTDNYMINLTGTINDLEIKNIVIESGNGYSGGINLNTNVYSVTTIDGVTLASINGTGFNINPETFQSRCCVIRNSIVFGKGPVPTVGYYFSSNAPDCLINNCYASQVQIGIKSFANILTVSNFHSWSGTVNSDATDEWWQLSNGLYLNSCTFYGTNIYLDTCHVPIYGDVSGTKCNVFIQNLSIWYDNTIPNVTYKDGSFMYGNLDLFVDSGLIYPSDRLVNIFGYDTEFTKNVKIKTDLKIDKNSYMIFPSAPFSNNEYRLKNQNTGGYEEICCFYLKDKGYKKVTISDNYGTYVDLNISNGNDFRITKKTVSGGGDYWFKKDDNIVTIYMNVVVPEFLNIKSDGSNTIWIYNYQNIIRTNNNDYSRDFVKTTEGLTSIQEG